MTSGNWLCLDFDLTLMATSVGCSTVKIELPPQGRYNTFFPSFYLENLAPVL